MEESIGLSNIARDVARNNSPKSEIALLEQEMGVTDTKGVNQLPYAQESKQQMKQAQAQKLQVHMDKEAKPKKDTDVLGQNKEAATSQLLGGVTDAVQGFVNSGYDLANFVDNKFGDNKYIPDDAKATFSEDWFPPSEHTGNKLMRGAVQFLIPYAGLSKAAKAAGIASKAMQVGVAGVATDFLAFEGDQQRISNLIQTVPELANPLTAYLAADPKDSALEGRFKNVLEGLGLGAMAEGVFKGARYLKNKASASKVIAAAEKTAEAIPPGAPDIPHQTPVEGKVDVNVEGQAKVDVGVPPTEKQVLAQELPTTPIEPAKLVEPMPLVVSKGGKHQVNLQQINAETDVLATIQKVAETDKVALEKRMGPTTTEEQLQLLAKETGVTAKDILSWKKGQAVTAQELYAGRTFHAAAAENLTTLAKKAAQTGSPMDRALFLEGLQAFRAINLAVTGAKAEAGRALRSLAFKVTSGGEAQAKVLSDYVMNWGGDNVDSMIKMASELSPETMATIARKSKTKAWFDATFEVYVNGLLANPAIQVANFASNFGAALDNLTNKAIAPMFKGTAKQIGSGELRSAVTLEKELSKLDTKEFTFSQLEAHNSQLNSLKDTIAKGLASGVESGEFRTATQAAAVEFAAQTSASFSGFFDGLANLAKTAWKGDVKGFAELSKQTVADPFTKMESAIGSISSDNIGGGAAVDILGGIQRLPSMGLTWGDRFWKSVNYRAEVHSVAYRLGKKQGLVGDELSSFVKEFANDPPDYVHALGEAAAKKATFTEALDGMYAKVDAIVKHDINDIGVQPLKFIVPFTRTNFNLTKFGVERSPLALLTKDFNEAIRRGGADAQMAKTKLALGSATLTTFSMLALNDKITITGGGPTDPKMRAQKTDTGWQPYSIKVGDSYIPFSKFEPINSYLRSAADLTEIVHAIGDEINPAEIGDIGNLIALSMVNRFTPEMITDNFGRLFAAMKGGDPRKDLGDLATDIAVKSVPIVNLTGGVRKYTDTTMRETRATKDTSINGMPWVQEIINNFKNRVPGLSSSLPARKNIWGDDVQYPPGIGFNVANPFIGSKMDPKDIVMKELVRLGYAGPLTKTVENPADKHLSIAMPTKSIVVSGATAELSAAQYARYAELSAGKGLKGAEQTLKERLADNIRNDYANAIRNPKYRSDKTKKMIIKETITAYRKAAKQQILDEFPELKEKLRESARLNQKAFEVPE